MFYPEWYEDRLSMCQECGGVIDGDPNAGEVGQPGEIDHKFLCPACFEKHPEAKTRLTPVAADGATLCHCKQPRFAVSNPAKCIVCGKPRHR